MDEKTLKQLIGEYDREQLISLIGCIVDKSEIGKQVLLDYCQKYSTSINKTLIAEKQFQQHWGKAADIIYEFDMYGGGCESDEENAYYELERFEEILRDNAISWEIRKSVLDEMLKFVASDNSGFTDNLVDIAQIMCTNKQENMYLADYLEKYGNFYYKRVAERMFLNNGENERFIESKKKNMEYGSDYLELAEYYESCGDKDKAVKIVQEGLKKADGRLDEIYIYLFQYYKENNDERSLEKLYNDAEKRKRNQDKIIELMYGYYKEKNNYEKQKSALLKLLKYVRESKLYELYQICKEDLTDEDFSDNEMDILKIIKKGDLTVYFNILLEKGESKEVLEYILHNQYYRGWRIDSGHYLSKRLAEEYPNEITEMYWKEVAFYVSLGKEKNYYHAVKVLKEIHKIMRSNNLTDEWNNRYQIFLEENRRKKLLLNLLKGF